MNILSLFDGMSCGRIALERAGIKVDNYYSAEIDKYAIKVADKNWPQDTDKRLGSVTEVKAEDLPKIDILIGGSPCQGFSFAGKQLNFDDPRSKLFFEYVRLLKECKPKFFLLENVKMKKEYQDVISKELGVEPIEINSSLVSAQNRKRLYWTNIPGVTQPEDKNVFLKDIVESGFVDREKSYCIDANYYKGGSLKNYVEKSRRQIVLAQSEKRLMVKCNVLCYFTANYLQYDLKGKNHKSQDQRAYYFNGKHGTLPSNNCATKVKILEDIENITIRKLTPIECERLQTVPDNYTECVSNTQRYKMLGNGWTVDVIAHLLSGLKAGHGRVASQMNGS